MAWRINTAGWLVRVAPATFFVASAFAVAVYALRRLETPLTPAWMSLAIAVLITGAGCWWRARHGFFTPAEARVFIESQLHLDSRLTAAELGLVPWPPAPQAISPVVRWRLRTPAGWVGASVILIVFAVLAPVPRDGANNRPSGPPPALVQTEAMLDALKEMNVAEPQAIEQLQERARELARRPSDEQYSHSALEAADALRNQTVISAAGLARGLDSAANAMRSANNEADMSGPAGQLSAALSGLRDGVLPANKELLSNLPASAADLKNLTPEQRAELAQQLADAANSLNGITGAFGAGARVAEPDPNTDGETLAGGGPGGGGPSAPLMLNAQQSDAGDGKSEALSGDVLKRFSLGDKLGTTSSAHDVDPNKAEAPSVAGAVASPAAGGEAVWVNRLTPAERAALKNFFK